jgi:signal transduction histidine kinase
MQPRGPGTLRAKFFLSLALISALLTTAVLLLVRYRVQLHVKDEIGEFLEASVATFQSVHRQRESTLQRSAALLATLPTLKAVMTSGDPATIQDASHIYWELSGSQLFVLVDREARLMALHASRAGFPSAVAETSVRRYLDTGMHSDWWFGNGHLYEVFLQPIYFGSEDDGHPIGVLAVGYEVDSSVAEDLRRVTSSHVAFGYDSALVTSTVSGDGRRALEEHLRSLGGTEREPRELTIGTERFLVTSVRLPGSLAPPVTLTVLRSFDQATAFLESLNRWIAVIGLAAVLAGGVLVYMVATSFTRPLGRLVWGVRALERGDYEYPLEFRGRDEVSALTSAFVTMRSRLQETQQQLVEAEQLATIGRMASTISHDLRHPLTAIQAYAEFLAERDLTDAQRRDCYEEIQAAVNRMMDEINALLAFSKQGEELHPVEAEAMEVVERAIRTMKALPEFEAVAVTSSQDGPSSAWFDPPKLERVLLNLLVNAGEALLPSGGRIHVSCTGGPETLEIRVADSGPGIAPEIRDKVFQPFVTHGKQNGIGLGLTVVQSIVQQHGGEARVERSGEGGTVFLIALPRRPREGARTPQPVARGSEAPAMAAPPAARVPDAG